MSLKNRRLKACLCFLLAVLLVLPSLPLPLFAFADGGKMEMEITGIALLDDDSEELAMPVGRGQSFTLGFSYALEPGNYAEQEMVITIPEEIALEETGEIGLIVGTGPESMETSAQRYSVGHSGIPYGFSGNASDERDNLDILFGQAQGKNTPIIIEADAGQNEIIIQIPALTIAEKAEGIFTVEASFVEENIEEDEIDLEFIIDGDEEEPYIVPVRFGAEELPGQKAYVEAANITYDSGANAWTGITDGTVPFDMDEGDGNDTDAHNLIVRSFDSITYTLNYTTALADGIKESIAEGKIYIRMELPVSEDIAEFDVDAMDLFDVGYSSGGSGSQVVTGWTYIPNESGFAIPGTGTFRAAVNVKGAANGVEIQPDFWLWLEGNEEAQYAQVDEVPVVTVSAAPRYNIQIKRNTNMSYKESFNFETGEQAAEGDDPDNVVNGRMYGYGVTLQLYNDSADKGLKGIELPQGDITFDLELTFRENDKTDITDAAMPLLWDYKLNNNYNNGNMGRNMLWLSNSGTRVATSAAPIVGISEANWVAIKNNPGTITANQQERVISVTISGYDFNTDTYPTNNISDTLGADIRYGENVASFSAGYFQILNQFPAVSQGTTFYLDVEATNLRMESLSKAEMDQTGRMDMLSSDDAVSDIVYETVTGAYDKRAWLTGPGATIASSSTWLNSSSSQGDSWALLGSSVKMWGVIITDSKNDPEADLYAVNLLQKFDDKAFAIAEDQSVTVTKRQGEDTLTYNMLYAARKADPTKGWEGDDTAMVKAVEEDFIYFSSLADLENAGYVCTAYLIEGRGGKISAATTIDFGVLMKLSDDESLQGQVFQTTNVLRFWRQGNYPPLEASWSDPDSMEPYLSSAIQINREYRKTVYEDDGRLSGHLNSYQGGQSLLLVNYAAKIQKQVSNPDGTMPAASTVPTYTIERGGAVCTVCFTAGNLHRRQPPVE